MAAIPPPFTPEDVQVVLLTHDWQNDLSSILRFENVTLFVGGINGGALKGTFRNAAKGNHAVQHVEGTWVISKDHGVLLSWAATFRILDEGNPSSVAWTAYLKYSGLPHVEPYMRASWSLSSLDKKITTEGAVTWHPLAKSGGRHRDRGHHPSPFDEREIHPVAAKRSDPHVVSQVLLSHEWVFKVEGASHVLEFRQATIASDDPVPARSHQGGVLTGFYRRSLAVHPPVTEEFILEGTWAVDADLGVLSYSATSSNESGGYSGDLASVSGVPHIFVKGYQVTEGKLQHFDFVGVPKQGKA